MDFKDHYNKKASAKYRDLGEIYVPKYNDMRKLVLEEMIPLMINNAEKVPPEDCCWLEEIDRSIAVAWCLCTIEEKDFYLMTDGAIVTTRVGDDRIDGRVELIPFETIDDVRSDRGQQLDFLCCSLIRNARCFRISLRTAFKWRRRADRLVFNKKLVNH